MFKRINLIFCLLLLFLACEKKGNDIVNTFRQAEQLEADIIKDIDKISRCRDNYEKVLKFAPESEMAPVACYKLGKLNQIFGHYDEAIEFYQKLLTYYPEAPVCASGLFDMAQTCQLHLDRTDDAISTYQQFIALYPGHEMILPALLQQGQLYCQELEWELALENFQQIVTRFPENKICDDLYFRMADIFHFELDKYPQAMQMYQNLKDNYPASPWIKNAESRLAELRRSENEK